MKLNVIFALVLSLVMATDYHHLLGQHRFNLEDFIRGFFKGAFDYYGMTNTEHCGEYSGNFDENLEITMHGFWIGTYAQVIESIAFFGFTIADIAQMLFDCAKIDHHDFE